MRWLFVCGLTLDIAGATLVAWTIYTRSAVETREEALSRLDGNLWVVVFRLRKQAYVRAGLALLGVGFLLQLAGYLSGFHHEWQVIVALIVSAALYLGALLAARKAAERAVPVRYANENELPDGLEDERHSFRLRTLADVSWWRRTWGERISNRSVQRINQEIRPRVNHGAWLFECPTCNSRGTRAASRATPGIDTVVCLICGSEYPASYPADLDEITRLLMFRPKDNRNWDGETVAELRRENVGYGFPQ